MSNSLTRLHDHLLKLRGLLLEDLSRTHYTPSEGSAISVKSLLQSLLSNGNPNPNVSEKQLQYSIKDFGLACALLASSRSSTHELLSWIPEGLSVSAKSAFSDLSRAYCASGLGTEELSGLECGLVSEEKRLVVELMPEVLPLLKDRVKESSIDKSVDGDEVCAATARVPVGYAILAAYQFRWFVTQVEYPHLGKLCTLVIPCGLTALDHWSPEIKGQGMISFIHLGKNVNTAELVMYGDVILDACCQNIASSDEIWPYVVEMSVLLVSCIQRGNPRSQWFERMLNEMLGHLERQPRNKDRRIAWLKYIEPLLCEVGVFLLAHFRRMFPLFFQWMHADDDQTVLLVLKQIRTVIKLTWIRNTPYVERLVNELVVLYKEAALRIACEEIRTTILEILLLIQRCKGPQFEACWDKYKDDLNLVTLNSSLSRNMLTNVCLQLEETRC
ncbi:hypothetical protein K2173_004835 [Erythroxylum novogranatense]|uniref:ARM repeat superfamily protein n=1 Tax=Erythroxylum novogranatense TaxID=1862640 RepID=A0AAV8TCP6_9ROSI|nr:hypothetical protein K2173_004835 [Erythroxylum novogranatense]